jgi:ATP-dependent Lon protease
VLPVGGVREKVLAAHRAGIKTVIIPKKNLKDLVDVPKKARNDLNICPVEHLDEVLKIAVLPSDNPKASPKSGARKKARTKKADSASPPEDIDL